MCNFKIRPFFLSLLLLPPLYVNAENPVTKKTVHHTTATSASPVFNTEIKPQFVTHTNSVINAIGIQIKDIYVSISHIVQDKITKENYELLKKIIKELLWQNRYKIAGGTVLGSYSTASLLLVSDYHQLNNNMFWAQWKRKSTFEDLCAIPQKELAKELLLAIGQHHFNKDNPTDLAYPLITFIKDIDWEINTIKRYIMTTKTIKRLCLMPLFPTNDHKLNRATKMLERALFIKHIFLSWLADYNLTNTEKLNG